MPVRIILGHRYHRGSASDRRRAVPLALQAHPFGQVRPVPHPGSDQPQGRGRGHRGGRASASCCSGRSPALAHFFTMWGFTILLLTIIEAYGDLFNKDFHIPLIGTWDWVGGARGLLHLRRAGGAGRVRHHPPEERPAAPRAQVPFLRVPHRRRLARPPHDRPGHDHAAPLPRRAGEHRALPVPLRLGRLCLPRRGQAARSPGRGHQRRAGHGVPHPQRGRHLGLHRLRGLLEAPPHLPGAHQRGLLPPAPGPGRPRQDARHGHGERRRGHRVRRGRDRPLHLEADARLRHLHRVRALPVGLPGLDHRQAAVARSSSS